MELNAHEKKGWAEREVFTVMSKKFLILVAFILCFAIYIFSFSNKNKTLEEKIIGTWEAQNLAHESTVTFNRDFTMTDVIPKGTFMGIETGGTFEGTYKIEGNELTTTTSDIEEGVFEDFSWTYTIEIEGKMLYMDDGFKVINYKKVK